MEEWLIGSSSSACYELSEEEVWAFESAEAEEEAEVDPCYLRCCWWRRKEDWNYGRAPWW